MDSYVEVDTKQVNDYKNKVLEEVKAKEGLPEQICERQVISMDFSKESTKDLPSHGFKEMPTCWVLEGLVMYLEKDVVKKMYEEISDLSPAGSQVIINCMAHHPAAGSALAEEVFGEKGWTKSNIFMFGDAEFNFGRYPEGMEPNAMMGFIFLHK
jgi:O-methyltransferase involved in polyketide biosynthesis